MWLTHAAVRRPVAMAMFFIAVGLMGIMAYLRLPKQMMPDTDIPYITVYCVYPGASPDDAERLVGEPIEKAVSTISGVDEVNTVSRESLCYIVVAFEVGQDVDEAAADVRDKVSSVLNDLPDDAEQPVVQKMDISAEPTIVAGATSSQLAPRELRTFADRTISDRLAGAKGVATVSVNGGEVREIQVRAKQDRLQAIGMSLTEFRAWLALQNLDVPSGDLDEGEKNYSVRVLGQFKSPEEIRQLTFKTEDGAVIRLRDVADVEDSVAKSDTISRLNGEPSVSFTVTKASNANVIETADAIKERLGVLEKTLPGDVKFTVSSDESEFTKDSLHDLVTSLIYGVLFATALVFWVLRNLRATTIIFFAIPTSLLATFMVMDLIGFTMNFMTMLGLALAVGILVDDSIVVLENIYRHLAMGKPPVQAAIDGRQEIGLAAVAITLTDVVVFVPIAMMGGIIGKFFRPFGATVAFATMFSLLVSFTITPMLAARWMKGKDVGKHGADEGDTGEIAVRNRTRYVRILDFCISRWGRWVTIVCGFGLLVVILLTVGKSIGMDFMSSSDRGEFNVYLELPIEKNLDASDRMARQAEEIVRKHPEVKTVITTVGKSADKSGKNFAELSVKCCDRAPKMQRLLAKLTGKTLWETKDPEKSVKGQPPVMKTVRTDHVDDIVARIQRECAEIPGVTIRVRGPSRGMGGMNPIEVELSGSRDAGLIEYANKVAERFHQVPEFQGINLGYKVGKPEIQARMNRTRIREMGLSAAQVASALRYAIEGDTSLKYREGSDEFDIRIELQDSDVAKPDDVGNIIVATKENQPVRLREVADVKQGVGPAELTRKNRQDMISVGLSPGTMATSEAMTRVDAIMTKELPVPVGMSYKIGGDADIMADSMGFMMDAMMVAVILVFALLVMLFESWFYPFIIMMGVPMALSGAYLGLKVAGCTNSIFGMIGFIMLIGLVTKNAILLIDYTNTLRSRGYSRHDALLRAGPTRMRPIMMTTFALVLSLLPISTGFGRGSEMRQPLGAAVTGGVLFSMYLTLLVMPALYTVMDDVQGLYMRIKRFMFRIPVDADAEKPDETNVVPDEDASEDRPEIFE
jgi:hydrophobic/amphiphilic exporter-1 (mainly G- bacteria), HAE1 family